MSEERADTVEALRAMEEHLESSRATMLADIDSLLELVRHRIAQAEARPGAASKAGADAGANPPEGHAREAV